MYRIDITFGNAICFIDVPIFDAIIAYAYAKEKLGSLTYKTSLSKQELEEFELLIEMDKFPIKKHEDGYYISSYMQYDNSEQFKGSWKKRWCNQYDFIADFGNSKKAIEIDKGSFKSYDMPLNLHSIPTAYFYFDSDNVDQVSYLFEKHIWGIGKKNSQGYGKISSFVIKEIDYNPFENVIRPIPLGDITEVEKMDLFINRHIKHMRIKPPYWSSIDSQLVRIK